MDIEIDAEAKDKRLNRLVALTVVVLSIFMGLGQVKDGNIVTLDADISSRWGPRLPQLVQAVVDALASVKTPVR